MNPYTKLQHVNKNHPCPICGIQDWCGYKYANDGHIAFVICMRVSDGAKRMTSNGGWLHVLAKNNTEYYQPYINFKIPFNGNKPFDFPQIMRRWNAATHIAQVKYCEKQLGLPTGGLVTLGCSIVEVNQYHSYIHNFLGSTILAVAMRNGRGEITGIQVRGGDHSKHTIRKSRLGLFIPDFNQYGLLGLYEIPPQPHTLIITEGLTDTAAISGLGLPAIGRPSCSSCIREVVEYCRRLNISDVTILADADTSGRDGAQRLAYALSGYVKSVRLGEPPIGFKDARDWVKSGVSADDVLKYLKKTADRINLKITISI